MDLDTVGRISYGNLVCVMNNNSEILCVNSLDEVCVKHIEDITLDDHISFKIIDLDNLSNLKNIKIGQSIWLQVNLYYKL